MDESLQKHVQIINELGLHARAAANLAKIAREARSGAWLFYDDKKVDATDLLGILTLACGKGSNIVVGVNSADDVNVLEKIVELILDGFGEL